MPSPAFSGSQIQISAPVGNNDPVYVRQHAQIASLQDGGFIVVWQQYHATNSPFDSTSIQAQFYNADGTKQGEQFQVDAPIYDTQDLDVFRPSVIVKADGKVLIAWQQQLHTVLEGDDSSDIRLREITPRKIIPNPEHPEDRSKDTIIPMQLGSVSRALLGEASETAPKLAALSDGNYIFMAGGIGGHSPYGVKTPESPVPVSAGFGGDIAGLSGGGWVNAKMSYWETPEAQGYGIEVSAYFRHGPQTLLSRTIKVPINFEGNQENPSIVGLSNGNFVVVWQDNDPAAGDGSGSCIKARIFRLDKSKINDSMAVHKIDIVPVTGEIIVNSKTAGMQMMPVVEALPGGGFVVAFQDWASTSDPYAMDVRVASFNSMGARNGNDQLVAANMDGRQTNPSIAVLKDGRFVVSWQDGGGSRIKAQIFGEASANPDPNTDPLPTSVMGDMGDNTFDGTEVEGLFDGGGGFDTVSYASSRGHVEAWFNPDNAHLGQGHGVDDRFINIEAVIGTDFNDKFFGYTGNERLDGGKGDDTLMGGDGNDYLIGGEGNDSLVGGEGADTLDGGAGNNTFDVDSADTRINTSGMGKQTVQANVSYALTKSAKIDVLKAGSTAGSINLTGNAFDNDMIGNAGSNTLKGDGGNDKIAGGAGRDVLAGGKGRDAFIFDTKLGADNLDIVLDYNPKTDAIWLDNGIFTKLATRGSVSKPAHLKKAFFTIGDKAKDANDYIIYDKATGGLSYDADGSGTRTAIEFAKLKPNLALTYKDIFVI